MLEIKFVDGDSRHFELTDGIPNAEYSEKEQSYKFNTTDGVLIIPREFIKSILIVGEWCIG